MDRGKLIVDAIRRSVKDKGFPPTVRELQVASGLKSTSTVHLYLQKLEADGLIRRDPRVSRGIELNEPRPSSTTVPLLGRVQAGEPVLAEQNRIDELPVPSQWIPEGTFALTVQGDSMMDAGIYNQDVVFVDPEARIANGDTVVALLGDEATVKDFYREKDQIRLQPRNPAFTPILVRDVQILGKVVGLFRKLG